MEAIDTQRRLALLIGNSQYRDDKLSQLIAPPLDVKGLASVLEDPNIGQFDVTTCIDQVAQSLRLKISEFTKNGKNEDLLLIYFSGHGILDDKGRLYFATYDTIVEHPDTGLPADSLKSLIDECNSRNVILILDCCYSGAFVAGSKKQDKIGSSVNIKRLLAQGNGRYILTATNAVEQAWEGESRIVLGKPKPSVYTRFLIEGIKTGEADGNNDGYITVNELHEYICNKIEFSDNRKQTPQLFWV